MLCYVVKLIKQNTLIYTVHCLWFLYHHNIAGLEYVYEVILNIVQYYSWLHTVIMDGTKLFYNRETLKLIPKPIFFPQPSELLRALTALCDQRGWYRGSRQSCYGGGGVCILFEWIPTRLSMTSSPLPSSQPHAPLPLWGKESASIPHRVTMDSSPNTCFIVLHHPLLSHAVWAGPLEASHTTLCTQIHLSDITWATL